MRRTVVFRACFAGLVALNVFAVHSAWRNWEELKIQQLQYLELSGQIADRSVLKRQVIALEKSVRENPAVVVVEPDAIDNTLKAVVSDALRSAGASDYSVSVNPDKEYTPVSYATISATFSVDPENATAFIANLESGSPRLAIRTLSLDAGDPGNARSVSGRLTASLRVLLLPDGRQ